MVYPNTPLYSSVSEALTLFIVRMRPYVAQVISNETGGNWARDFYSKLRPNQQKFWNDWETKSDEELVDLIDYGNLPAFGINYKNALLREVGNKKLEVDRLILYFRELQDFRNQCRHEIPIEEDAIHRAFMNMKDSAKILEMQDLKDDLGKIEEKVEERKEEIIANPASDKSLEIIRSFEKEDIKYRRDVFGYELRIQEETYFLIFGYKKTFAYCDLIADRAGQPLPKEADRLIREFEFEKKDDLKTQPKYLVRKFELTTNMDEGKKFLDEILEILKKKTY